MAGCGSDASRAANTLEKLCKAQCDCPDSMEIWNEVKNCKKSCEGYSLYLEAIIADETYTEPCGDFGRILGDLKKCATRGCGDERDICVGLAVDELRTCWPDFYADGDDSAAALTQQLMTPIPGAIDAQTLHSAL
ncbi:hypothetical protein DB30_04981 [Enhygromyxa salina]|uniref:Uncharacterized protein n=1 Tax=Enhygromyxa salina TaxID=215803 RepID=A0A0C1ZEK8_9BACT|nr:hypothetical protein DB30_04981 [Enhygromyxa salina]